MAVILRRLVLVVLTCAWLTTGARAQPPAPPLPPAPPSACPLPSFGAGVAGRIVVFVADGAGDSSCVYDNLSELVSDMRLPLTVIPVSWSRFGSVAADYADQTGQFAGACWMAAAANKARHCGAHVVFIGHSAGTRVVLAAAEKMEPGSVDRIILLASSVSCRYDLSCALRTSCAGIDNFYSWFDPVLPLTTTYGTSDNQLSAAAGEVGFRCPPGAPWPNLRQYCWREGLCGSGGHFAWALKPNLRKCIVPLILSPMP